ncbi:MULTISPECIES: hypothetical protein [Streptococcus]|uniref:Uncharacterized protein n=1 Tax=Streptococcus pantholopis TaxID=1811193 RepID=A0A172Q721_9STRE|nr:hypothetical protein [Streptococcus pantholopis]AND79217.1 hypothetical protein A0O21_03820 [Streptococcus pantholopis]
MKMTMWIMFFIGVTEMVANLFFLFNITKGKGLKAAKKFHGDFPAYATDKAWILKILVSLVLGLIAIAAAFSIYFNTNSKMLLSALFVGGLFSLCSVQAILYGKKYIPARISIVVAVTLILLVFLKL